MKPEERERIIEKISEVWKNVYNGKNDPIATLSNPT